MQPRGGVAIPHLNASADAKAKPGASEPQAARPAVKLHEDFTEVQLNLMWDAYIGANPTAHILINTMRASRPKLVEKARFVVTVANAKQIEIMNQAAPSLLEYLRRKLKNDDITFEVIENDGESAPRTWNNREVYHHMLENHPALKAFVEEFKMKLN